MDSFEKRDFHLRYIRSKSEWKKYFSWDYETAQLKCKKCGKLIKLGELSRPLGPAASHYKTHLKEECPWDECVLPLRTEQYKCENCSYAKGIRKPIPNIKVIAEESE